nr:ribonuclease H-like domain-containing protein [Tanacetum cinerariifolium]
VDGLPLKVFTNEHNCVACNKGKQHKASYKPISTIKLVTESLQLLHMDLFGPTNIRSIDQKYYSLVVTDDFTSKAYRVYDLTSKRVEETMNLRFMEDKPNVQGIGNPDDDSDSEYDEQVIVVPSFPSNSFASPSSRNGPSVTERNADYAKELARLQRQEYEAKDAAERYGYLFSQETVDILRQAEADIRKNGVSAVTTLPPGQSLGSSENTTRFPVPSDVCKDQLSSGIFTSSSYDDDFSATLINLAPSTKRMNTVHPQSQIIGDLASPVQTRSRAQKSKFGESAFIGYLQDQQRTNHTDQLHCLFACFLS